MSDESTRIGCGSNSCIFNSVAPRGGMRTNGGCRCFDSVEFWIESEGRWNREEVSTLRRNVQAVVKALLQERKNVANTAAERDRFAHEAADLRSEVGKLKTHLSSTTRQLELANRLLDAQCLNVERLELECSTANKATGQEIREKERMKIMVDGLQEALNTQYQISIDLAKEIASLTAPTSKEKP